MNRAVVTFTNKELLEVRSRLNNIENIPELLMNKVEIGIKSGSDQGLELSENDLEIILDEFILPQPSDTDHTLSVRKKIQQRLLDFRSQS